MKIASFLSTAILALSYGVQTISAQVMPITPGIYQFVNRVTNVNGTKLALTVQGSDQDVIVTPLVPGQLTQLWNVTTFARSNATFQISTLPSAATGGAILQISPPVPGALQTVTPSSFNQWMGQRFTNNNSFTFSDSAGQNYWNIDSATLAFL